MDLMAYLTGIGSEMGQEGLQFALGPSDVQGCFKPANVDGVKKGDSLAFPLRENDPGPWSQIMHRMNTRPMDMIDA